MNHRDDTGLGVTIGNRIIDLHEIRLIPQNKRRHGTLGVLTVVVAPTKHVLSTVFSDKGTFQVQTFPGNQARGPRPQGGRGGVRHSLERLSVNNVDLLHNQGSGSSETSS